MVYNHLGPEGNYLRNFGPYFTAHHKTPWGDAVNYDAAGCEQVRRYVVENALYWIREYHLDGLRLDAVQTIKDDSPQHILAEIQERVQVLARELERTVNVIAETDENDSRYTRAAMTAAMDSTRCGATTFIMPCTRTSLASARGYYQGFGEPEQIARALREGYVFQGQHYPLLECSAGSTSAKDVPLPANVISLQNHDQVGNRAKGERLSALYSTRRTKAGDGAAAIGAAHAAAVYGRGVRRDRALPVLRRLSGSRTAKGGQRRPAQRVQGLRLQRSARSGRSGDISPLEIDMGQLGPQNRDMLEWYRQLLQLRKQHVTNGQRTADAQYAEGVLTMQVPATNPKIMVQAALERGRSLPNLEEGWREVLRSDEDGYAVQVRVR